MSDVRRFIYFVQCEAVGLVKIGCTRDIRRRLDALATFSPVRLELVGLIRGTFADEEALHRRFAEHRLGA